MVASAITLLKNHSFILKIVELVVACTSLGFLAQYEIYEIPRWLWITYCIDSMTYMFILLVIGAAYVFEAEHELIELIFSITGALLYLIGGLSGILRYNLIVIEEIETSKNELYIGILLNVNALLMLLEVVLRILKTIGRSNRDPNDSIQETVRS